MLMTSNTILNGRSDRLVMKKEAENDRLLILTFFTQLQELTLWEKEWTTAFGRTR